MKHHSLLSASVTALPLSAFLLLPCLPAQAQFKIPKIGKLKDKLDDITGKGSKDAERDEHKKMAKTNLANAATMGALGNKTYAGIYLGAAIVQANKAKLRANKAANGSPIGVGSLKWGMTTAQVNKVRLSNVSPRAVSTKLGGSKSLEYSNLRMFSNSPRRFAVQLWFKGESLNSFEIRPMSDGDATGARDEMFAYCSYVWPTWKTKARELKTDTLERAYNYRVLTGTHQMQLGSHMVMGAVGNDGYGNTVAALNTVPDYVTMPDYATETGSQSLALGFTVTQDDWKAKNGVAYRLAMLQGQSMNVARLQGRREGGLYPFVLSKNRNLDNTKAVAADIQVNYNTSPHAFR